MGVSNAGAPLSRTQMQTPGLRPSFCLFGCMSKRAKVQLVDPTEKLERVKLYLCHCVKKACRRNGWDQTQSAIYIGTSRYRMHLVDRLKTEQLTVQLLMRFLSRVRIPVLSSSFRFAKELGPGDVVADFYADIRRFSGPRIGVVSDNAFDFSTSRLVVNRG